MRRIAAVLLLTLAVPAAARAESIFVGSPRSAQPLAIALAGDRLVWVEGGPDYGSLRIVSADLSTRRTRTLAVVGEPGNLGLESLTFGASDSLLRLAAQFDEGSVIAAGKHDELHQTSDSWWDIDGSRVLTPVDRSTLRVRDALTGESADVPIRDDELGVQSAALAGDLAGYWRRCCGRIVNWRTGQELFGQEIPSGWIADLEPDGTALWGRTYGSAYERFEYRLSIGGELGGLLPVPNVPSALLGGRRVAYDDPHGGAIGVIDAAGRPVAWAPFPARTQPVTVGDYRALTPFPPKSRLADFDGRRAVFTYSPCVGPVVAVWDVDAGPLRAPIRCRAARLAGPVRRVPGGAVSVPLRCARRQLTGCPTNVTVRTPSERVTVRANLTPSARRDVRVAVGAARRATVVTAPAVRPAAGERRVRRVRVRR